MKSPGGGIMQSSYWSNALRVSNCCKIPIALIDDGNPFREPGLSSWQFQS
jgi:hypothetical protein